MPRGDIYAPDFPKSSIWLNTTRPLSADTYNHAIKAADLEKKEITTLFGRQKRAVCLVDGQCEFLPLFEPNDVVLKGRFLYIADTNNHLIRVLDLDTNELREVKIVTYPLQTSYPVLISS